MPEKTEKPRPVAGLPPDSPEAIEIDRQLAEAEKKLTESQMKMQTEIDRFKTRKERYLEAMRNEASALFRKRGLLPGDGSFTSRLLDHKVMSRSRILELLLYGGRELRPTAGIRSRTPGVSGPARELYGMFMVVYPDFGGKTVPPRQEFWRRRPGTAAEIQRQMLETDHLMQALALDLLLREKVNAVLEAGRFRPGDKTELGELFRLREGLLNPEPAGFPRHLFAESAQKL